MDIEELRTFVEVADAGGVSPAALRLGVSKSIVSRRLARLEAELGVQLLARTTRGAALTEAGTTFRDYAARVVAEIDVAKETILPAGDLRGRLRIAAPLSFGPTHFAPVLADMARRHPATAHPGQLQRSVRRPDRGGIRLRDPGWPSCRTPTCSQRRVGPIHWKLVASPDYIKAHGSPETPEELVTHEALMQGTETWQRWMATRSSLSSRRGGSRLTTASLSSPQQLAGLGIAWSSRWS